MDLSHIPVMKYETYKKWNHPGPDVNKLKTINPTLMSYRFMTQSKGINFTLQWSPRRPLKIYISLFCRLTKKHRNDSQFSAINDRRMMWKRRLHKVLLHIVLVSYGFATAFGLTTFNYRRKNKSFVDSKALNRYCKFMGLLFFVLYPLSLLLLLPDFDNKSRGVTDLARNSVFIGNWLLCTLIFVSQTSCSIKSCSVYNRAGALYADIMKNQYNSFYNDDIEFKLSYTTKCVLKTCFLAIGFFLVNITKFYFILEQNISPFQSFLFPFLFVPSFIMTLASNRFYVATTFCIYLLMKINSGIKAVDEGYRGISEMREMSVCWRNLSSMTAGRISRLERNYAELHQIFIDFNGMNAKYIGLILGFCFMNVVFEVRSEVPGLDVENFHRKTFPAMRLNFCAEWSHGDEDEEGQF